MMSPVVTSSKCLFFLALCMVLQYSTEGQVVHGGWSRWSNWGRCSCPGGSRSRSRSCSNPAPDNGGRRCSGPSSSSKMCICPRDGGWSPWSSWSSCSKTCGSTPDELGERARARKCNSPTPAHRGRQCAGAGRVVSSCTVTRCPIDGVWGPWGLWSTCKDQNSSRETRTRTRSCNNPAPQYRGRPCPNLSSAEKSCSSTLTCDDPARCKLSPTGYLSDPFNSKKFYQCQRNGETYIIHHMDCEPGTQWNARSLGCE